MNAAARLLNESVMIATRSSQLRQLSLSKQMFFLLTLFLAVLLSGLALITLEDKNRIETGFLAELEQTQNNLVTTYNQLLLEKNTWNSPVRIEAVAHQLNMALPDPKLIVLVKE